MHIPSCQTDQLRLVPFDAALEAALAPSPDYDVSRWLYVPNVYAEYRYILGTRGERPLICVGGEPLHRRPGPPGQHPEVGGAGGPVQRL